MSEGRRKGKVKFFNRNKGFGYITASDGYDYFVHFSNIEGGRTSKTGHVYLATEEEVEFDPQYEERKDKWVANKVTCLAASDNPSIGKKGKVQKGKGSSEGKGNSKIEHEIIEEELHSAEKPVRSLTEHLIDAGVYSTYTAWRDAHEKWLDGRPKHSISVGAVYPLQPQAETRSWRDYYRAWREGKAQGAQGETGTAVARPLTRVRTGSTSLASSSNLAALSNEERPAVVFDVVVPDDEEAFRNVPAVVYKAGDPALVPVDGPPVPPILIRSFPPEALVTIRTFRFFEDRSDEKQVWEQELQNVNSGSLVFLPVHMCPGYHSLSGAKFGKWFTIHYIQVYAKHFSSSYFRADEGSCFPAKTFGATSATTSTVSGKELEKGYFWYVSPATEQATLENEGWQHLHRDGPFDGESFLEEWRRSRCPMEARALQEVLDSVICNDDAA